MCHRKLTKNISHLCNIATKQISLCTVTPSCLSSLPWYCCYVCPHYSHYCSEIFWVVLMTEVLLQITIVLPLYPLPCSSLITSSSSRSSWQVAGVL